MVWKEYGGEVAGSADIARIVETNLVEAIDCGDNGVDTFSPIEGKPFPYMLQRAFGAFVPVFDEDPSMYDKNFLELVDFAKKILIREIKMAKVQIEAKREVTRAYNEASDKRLIILDKEYYYQDALTEYPEPLFVVAPRSDSTYWKVGTVRAHKFGMDIREKLPEAWAGLRDQALAQVTGVKGSVFCHNARFLCITETKDEALALANLALTSLIK